jgi:hypothetical protein
MDNQSTNRIRFGKTKVRQIVPINGDLSITEYARGTKIVVGNTDLEVHYYNDFKELKADFTPEGKWNINEVDGNLHDWAYKATKIFLYAMYKLLTQLKAEHRDLVAKLETDYLIHNTNDIFARFLTDLFVRFNHADMISIEYQDDPRLSAQYQVKFDYRKLLELPKDDKLIVFMKRSAEKSEGMQIRGLVEVDQNKG